MKKIVFLIIISTLMLVACKKETNNRLTKTPDDFAISFSYGINENQFNILDTYKGKIQKDLITIGKADIDYVIPEADLKEIYSQLCKYKIYEITDYMKSPNLLIEPIMKYDITFTISGVEYNVVGDHSAMFYQEESEDVDNFCDFITYMTEYIQLTEEYKSLPETEGGYQ